MKINRTAILEFVVDSLKTARIIAVIITACAWFMALVMQPEKKDFRADPLRLRATRIGGCHYLQIGGKDGERHVEHRIFHFEGCRNPIHRKP